MELAVAGGALAALLIALTAWSLISTSRLARQDEERLRTAGIAGTARIVFIDELPHDDTALGERSLHLEVTLADGRTFEVKKYLYVQGAREPTIGDVITIRSHPDRIREVHVESAPFEYR